MLDGTELTICRRVLRGAIVILLTALAPVVIAADTANELPEFAEMPGITVTVAAPYVDMHTGPGRGYPIFHVVERREALRLLKRRTDWYKVITSEGKTGWVARAALHNSLAADGVPLDFADTGWQGYREQRWELGLQGGDFSGAHAMGVYLGYRMTDNLSAELHYTQAFGDFSDNKLGSLNIVHRPFPEWRLVPFFSLGVGTVKTSPSATLVETEDRQDNLLSVGGGVVFYITERFSLRADYNHHTLLTTRENNEEVDEWKAGFSVSF